MKRPYLWGIALFVAAAGAITVFKLQAPETKGPIQGKEEAAKSRVAFFWEIYNRAGVLRTQGEFGPAATAYRQALDINPNHEDSHYYLATCLYEMGEYEAAEAELRKLIRLNPESGRAYGQLGRLLGSSAPGAPADLPGARRAFERELLIYREQAGPLQELGGLELNQGQLARAEETFRTAIALGSPEAKFLTGYVLFLQKRPAEAKAFFRSVLEADWADRKITARGVLSEGDVLPAGDRPLTALQRAALKSALFSYWIDIGDGVSPARAAEALHLPALPPGEPALRLAAERSGSRNAEGRAAWAVSGSAGAPLLAVGGAQLTLYRFQAGRAVEVTKAAGLAGIRQVWEPHWVDLEGDGHPDLYLVRPGFTGTGQNLLYRQDHHGTFSNATGEMGLAGRRSTLRACFADFDGDGRLDLLELGSAAAGPSAVRLFHNAGTRFVETTGAAGLKTAATAVDCAVADYDGDGRPDLFLRFWRKDAVLYHNEGDARFQDVTRSAGLGDLHGAGFSSIFFDYDRDGRPDLLLTFQAPLEDVARSILEPGARTHGATPRMFHNLGNGTFQEVTASLGLNHAYGTMQALAADLDRDGWTDLVLVSGAPDAQFLALSVVLHNVAGQRFEEWPLAPGGTPAGNFLGGAILCPGREGSCTLYLAPNPILRDQRPGGLFRVLLTPNPKPASEAGRAHAGTEVQ